jgi:hypothetical protein
MIKMATTTMKPTKYSRKVRVKIAKRRSVLSSIKRLVSSTRFERTSNKPDAKRMQMAVMIDSLQVNWK